MGIKNLMKLLNSKAGSGIREVPITKYGSKIVALDASVTMYQCLIATTYFSKNDTANSFARRGSQTGHISGMLYKNIKFMELGIKPVWVFDGAPPIEKSKELETRSERKKEAQKKLEEAEEMEDAQEMVRQRKRMYDITPEMRKDAKDLLRYLGLPFVEAPGEAEAQCAILCRDKIVDAMATEDLDALIYQPNFLLRKFKNEKNPVMEFDCEEIRKELGLSSSQIVDLAILTGTDYCPSIKGIGPMRAYNLIKKHQTLEAAIKEISQAVSPSTKKQKYVIPDDYKYLEARELFTHPKVHSSKEISLPFLPPNYDSLFEFLKAGKFLSEKRIERAVERLRTKNANSSGKDNDIPDLLSKKFIICSKKL